MDVSSQQRASQEERNLVFIDVLSYAITGEIIGMSNYAAMVSLYDDPAKQMDAVGHAASELRHAELFRTASRSTGHLPIVNLEAQGWRDVRKAFRGYAEHHDLLSCLMIQEVMLESFAVALYDAVGGVADPQMSPIFKQVAEEEAEHVKEAVQVLRSYLAADPPGFEHKLTKLNDEVMYFLAHMVGERDNTGPCGLCQGNCLKDSIPTIGLERTELRGRAIQQYLRMLDDIGVRGELSLACVARLPL